MLSDIEIARAAKLKPILSVGAELGLCEDDLELYGRYKAKLSPSLWERINEREDGRLILVTAINPTPAGEGKTTTTVGLGQALCRLGKKAVIALREPSLGPVMGIKGGAAGGGYAQVVPMEDINLHFTGDLHAITAAHNLLAAALDNHLHQGNPLGIDQRKIAFKRAMDMNDRALRNTVIGLGGQTGGIPREDGFMITAASEVMAVLCLSSDIGELKARLGRIVAAYTFEGNPVTAADLKVEGAMALLLKDAIKPNLVQTMENTPCLIHGGPFANIAHGCNSVAATKYGLKLADYCITEAGFGADLGAEKFFDIKCRAAGLRPDAAVIVATVRALKYNGGVSRDLLSAEDLPALKSGLANLGKHIENIQGFGVPAVVALNAFDTDSKAEIDAVQEYCLEKGVLCAESRVFKDGGAGGVDLAQKVLAALDEKTNFNFAYPLDIDIKEKINLIAKRVYGAAGARLLPPAKKAAENLARLGFGGLPVCIAKTQYSLSDNPLLLGRPENFEIAIRDIYVSAGAGFLVALAGNVMTMPGLPARPSYEGMDISSGGDISGLF